MKAQNSDNNNDAVVALQYPEEVSQMRSFLGLFDIRRRLLLKFSGIAAPVNKPLEKGKPNEFVLDKQTRQAVDEVKNRLINSPVLALLLVKG